MNSKKLALAAIAVSFVGATSYATAQTTYGMEVYLSSPDVPQLSEAFDCGRAAGHRGHIEAVMTALDSCGNPVHSEPAGQHTSLETSTFGQTQYATLYNPSSITGPCGMVSKQRADLILHVLDFSTGESSYSTYLRGPVANWTSLSQTPSIWINSATSNSGACKFRSFTASSNGTIP